VGFDMANPVCPLDFRYGRKEIKNVFGETSKLQYLLSDESALARAHAYVGNIPQAAADEISKKATIQYVNVARVNEIEQETRHDIMAVTRALSEVCDSDAGKYVHLGATSYDIVDTANALQVAAATDLISKSIKELRKTLVHLAKQHRDTIMLGRTHGQFSIPITFGLKMAVYAMEVDRHLERMHECKSRVLVGKMTGAVGSGAAMGKHVLEIQRVVMADLKLGIEDAATQIVGRDRYIELVSVLGNIAASMEKFATEIRNLQRSEIAEVSESFESKKQVGSSTMPQKRNPIICEQICGLARLIRSFIIPTYENAIQWHERDLCNSSSERFILPHTLILTDWIVNQMNSVFSTIQIFPERMQLNIQRSQGLPMAEAVMTKLVEKGMGRGDAHEILRSSSMKAIQTDQDLLSILKKDQTIVEHLSVNELEAVFNPQNYLGISAEIVDSVVKKLTR